MLRLYDYLPSGNGYKVRLLLTQLGIPFERIELDIVRGATRTSEFLAKNPNGQVPTLEDGEICIWESNSIVRYLAARYGAGWIWEEDPARRAEADRWMDWMLSELQPAKTPTFHFEHINRKWYVNVN